MIPFLLYKIPKMTQLQQRKARLVWLEAKEGVGEETTCWILALMERFCIVIISYPGWDSGSVLQDAIFKGNCVKGYTGSF